MVITIVAIVVIAILRMIVIVIITIIMVIIVSVFSSSFFFRTFSPPDESEGNAIMHGPGGKAPKHARQPLRQPVLGLTRGLF